MAFLTDKQTLSDLNIQGKYKVGSMFNLFNRVKTKGGEDLMEKMFRSPLTDAKKINQRAAKIQYVQGANIKLDINSDLTRLADDYITDSKSTGQISSMISCFAEKLQESIYHSEKFELKQRQIQAVQSILDAGSDLLQQLNSNEMTQGENPCTSLKERLQFIIMGTSLKEFETNYPYTLSQMVSYRYLIEGKCRESLVELLQILYKFDVYCAVASVAEGNCFTYPKAQGPEDTDELIRAENLKHPSLADAVGNNLVLSKSKNLLFLTGANMAGKSTLMKSLGISFYLAHMGFPVAADSMSFIVMDGVYSSINVKDQIDKGWSHFYAEVMRMKQIAQKLTEGHRLFVLFDEMYKSTNVKDAYDATLAISQRLAQYNNCYFVVSTHIVEVGEELKDNANVLFRYLPTVMEGTVPRYTYDLTEGITDDRQGMIIVENEGILDMLKQDEHTAS